MVYFLDIMIINVSHMNDRLDTVAVRGIVPSSFLFFPLSFSLLRGIVKLMTSVRVNVA